MAYGSTLTDLQSGINAARGLQIQRDNAKDALNQQQLEAFLRLQGQKYVTQAQQNTLAADRAMRLAELAQQNEQFGTRERNLMDIAKMEQQSRLDVANATKGGLDPRAFETILAYNQQGADKVSVAQALSAQRKAALAEIKAAKDSGYIWGGYDIYNKFLNDFGRKPDGKSAATRLGSLDTQAAALGLQPDEIGGGYQIPNFQPIVPGALRGAGAVPMPNAGPLPGVTPQTQAPAPAMLQGDVTLGGEPLFPSVGLNVPTDGGTPPVASPTPTMRFRWTPNGAVAY